MNKTQQYLIGSLTLVLIIIFAALFGLIYNRLVSTEVNASVAAVSTNTSTPYPTLALPTSDSSTISLTSTATRVVSEDIDYSDDSSLNQEINEYVDAIAPPTSTPTPKVEQKPIENKSAGIKVSFSGNPTSISSGQCATLSWVTEGIKAYWVDGQPGAGGSGNRQVCPSSTTTYELKYQAAAENNFIKTHTQHVTISVGGNSSGNKANNPSSSPADRNQGSSSTTIHPSSGGSVSNIDLSAQKANQCNYLADELELLRNGGDTLGVKYVNNLMSVWGCDNPDYIPSNMCGVYKLHKEWAQAEGDITKVKKYQEDLDKNGC